ncbi:MAG: 7-cyano-7-deazaguanine synthase [Methanobacterium sp.]|uniref:7-cyano-7-deazaguanine synthase n=1 Tax=Methanobacterium sp. TaxID=2164 RepID=UPI002583F77C|nr:7-cyano-7-deazaguanine synthase [Methanobacterium sp.]MCC7561077.1 7-cyano-7-deazaguanine synthase [Methanobacterium sp.]
MKIEKKHLTSLISKIRREIGHKDVDICIFDIIFHEESGILLIITPDRPEKSVIIGKGGWVVGRLREELGVNSIHVEAYSDFIVPRYRMGLAVEKLETIIEKYPSQYNKPFVNLKILLNARIENPYDLGSVLRDFNGLDLHQEGELTNGEFKTVVALSGGIDSSTSLIIAKMLGFNPLAVTVNPGDIILPKYFRESVENLTQKLKVKHQYLDVDMKEVIEGSLEGRFHPCGRCSKTIEETVFHFTRENNIPFVIYGDLLSSGAQSIHLEEYSSDSMEKCISRGLNNDEVNSSVNSTFLFQENGNISGDKTGLRKVNFLSKGNVLKINLPALLSLKKGDVEKIAADWGVKKRGGYGCPLIGEVHRKHPHMRRFSIQRVLRETRAGVLEPGEALEQMTGMI